MARALHAQRNRDVSSGFFDGHMDCRMNGLNELIKYIPFVFELYSSDHMQSCEGVICGFL